MNLLRYCARGNNEFQVDPRVVLYFAIVLMMTSVKKNTISIRMTIWQYESEFK